MEDLDLSSLDTRKGSELGYELQLKHPDNGADLPVWVSVLGVDSRTYHNTLREQVRRRLAAAQKGRKQAALEDNEGDALHVLATCTVGWRGVKLDGVALEFSTKNAVMLYERFPWIREQVDRAIGDRANFLPSSSTSSSSSPSTSSGST